MADRELVDFTDQELREEKKKLQNNKIVNASLIGICIGVFVYSAVKNGFGYFTFFPLLLIYPFFMNGKKIQSIEKELKKRNLQD